MPKSRKKSSMKTEKWTVIMNIPLRNTHIHTHTHTIAFIALIHESSLSIPILGISTGVYWESETKKTTPPTTTKATATKLSGPISLNENAKDQLCAQYAFGWVCAWYSIDMAKYSTKTLRSLICNFSKFVLIFVQYNPILVLWIRSSYEQSKARKKK